MDFKFNIKEYNNELKKINENNFKEINIKKEKDKEEILFNVFSKNENAILGFISDKIKLENDKYVFGECDENIILDYNNLIMRKDTIAIIVKILLSNFESYENYKSFMDSKDYEFVIIKLTMEIEYGIFCSAVEKNNNTKYSANGFEFIYRMLVNKICANIDIFSSVNHNYLFNLIVENYNDEKFLFNIGFLPSDKLCPEKSAKIKNIIFERSNAKNNIKTTSIYTCGKCKKNKTTIKQIQIRSADEGHNLLVTCINPSCNNIWII
jgi:DNA-directed RNA polymerase subunit M/transcription elongation factor TFIIS